MAARKTRPPSPVRDAHIDQNDAADRPAVAASPAPVATRKSKLRLALAVFGVWLIVLVSLAIWSANPVTLNRQQIRRADLVIEAEITNVSTGECRITQTWPAGDVGPTITVSGLDELNVETGARYLIPLSRNRTGNGYSVVTTAPPEATRLIYPATDDARHQLSDILEGE